MKELKIYFDYLDKLRESGKTNMFGATVYLEQDFDMTYDEAKRILVQWMTSKKIIK